MQNPTNLDEFRKLDVPDQIRHVQALLDEIAGQADQCELTKEQHRELERRLRFLDENPDATIPGHVVHERLRKKYG